MSIVANEPPYNPKYPIDPAREAELRRKISDGRIESPEAAELIRGSAAPLADLGINESSVFLVNADESGEGTAFSMDIERFASEGWPRGLVYDLHGPPAMKAR